MDIFIGIIIGFTLGCFGLLGFLLLTLKDQREQIKDAVGIKNPEKPMESGFSGFVVTVNDFQDSLSTLNTTLKIK